MRKLKLQVQMTVDGLIAGPNGEMAEWLTMDWGQDINEYVGGIVKDIDTILLGRKLAEGFIPHWAGAYANPDGPEPGSEVFALTPKVVFTKTLETSEWDATRLAKGDLVEEVMALKNAEGGDLYACGGGTFVSSLIENDLIDEYHLFVNPAVMGKGMPIFQQLSQVRPLKLVQAVAFECGIVVLNYKRK